MILDLVQIAFIVIITTVILKNTNDWPASLMEKISFLHFRTYDI